MAIAYSNLVRHDAGDRFKVTGTATFSGTYATGGETLTATTIGLNVLEDVSIEDSGGYALDAVIASGAATALLKVYRGGAATSGATSGGTPAGTNAAEASHTHAILLDTGASAAGSSHTHTLALAASGAGSSHTHAILLDGGASAEESAHTHAILLDGGASATEAAHTHASGAFSGTAITTDTFTVAHDATPETSVVYVNTLDFATGFFSSDNSIDNATDYFQFAGGERCVVIDDNGAAVVATAGRFQVYYDDDGATADSRLLINNTITGTDLFVRTSGGKFLRIKHDAGAAATGVALYFNDDGADKTLNLNGTLPGTANVTTNATDDTYRGLSILAAGTIADSAAGSAHSHGPGTLADAASGVGSAHSHGPGTLADAASGSEAAHTHTLTGTTVDAEAAHSHGPGTLADAASGIGSSHNHVFTGSSLATHTHSISAAAFAEHSGALTLVVDFAAYGY